MLEESAIQALIGGLIIGISASVLILLSGRIAGISGILHGALFSRGDRFWRILFLAGLLLGGFLCHLLTGRPPPELAVTNPWLAIVGGLVVGYGVRLGSGCTSGHGICGIARLSKRSIAATFSFIAAGMATVAILKLVGGVI